MDWPYVNRYQCRVSSQPARLEILQDLYTCKRTAGGQMQHGGVIRELLIAFYQASGQKPARVIFFRSARPPAWMRGLESCSKLAGPESSSACCSKNASSFEHL